MATKTKIEVPGQGPPVGGQVLKLSAVISTAYLVPLDYSPHFQATLLPLTPRARAYVEIALCLAALLDEKTPFLGGRFGFFFFCLRGSPRCREGEGDDFY